MRRYRVSKGIVSGTIELNDKAAQDYRNRGYTVQDIGPSLMITYGDDGLPTDWEHVGYAAFHRGTPAVPYLDRHVTDALEVLQLQPGQGAADIFRAWSRGWTRANLAAPVA